MGFLQIIQLVAAVISAVPSLVTEVEKLAGAGNGSQKNALVTGLATAIATAAGANSTQAADIGQAASSAATAVVSTMNAVGVFKKSQPPLGSS